MKTIIKLELLAGLLMLVAFNLPIHSRAVVDMSTEIQMMLVKQTPQPPTKAFTYSIFRTAPLEVAEVFGRTPGCEDADAGMIQSTANAAIEAGLDPSIAAATVGVESGCNGFAISSRGAIGYFQVMPKIWASKFDFTGSVNLLNRDDNMRVGAKIEADLIAQYGMDGGIRRFNGTGVGCDTCDAGYTTKILNLAGRK